MQNTNPVRIQVVVVVCFLLLRQVPAPTSLLTSCVNTTPCSRKVVLHGLRSAVALNGRAGVVIASLNSKGRVGVQLDVAPDQPPEKKTVKLGNLMPQPAAAGATVVGAPLPAMPSEVWFEVLQWTQPTLDTAGW